MLARCLVVNNGSRSEARTDPLSPVWRGGSCRSRGGRDVFCERDHGYSRGQGLHRREAEAFLRANRDLAETVSIDTRATDRLTFFIGSGLAGIAGVALTLLGSTGPTHRHV